MYCVELTPAAYWIFAWLKKRQQYYNTLTSFKYSGNTNIDSLIERDNTNSNSNSLYIE